MENLRIILKVLIFSVLYFYGKCSDSKELRRVQLVFHCDDAQNTDIACGSSNLIKLKNVTYEINYSDTSGCPESTCGYVTDVTGSSQRQCQGEVSECNIKVDVTECRDVPGHSRDHHLSITIVIKYRCEHVSSVAETPEAGGSGPETLIPVPTPSFPSPRSPATSDDEETEKKIRFLMIISAVCGAIFLSILVLCVAVCVLCRRSVARGRSRAAAEISTRTGPRQPSAPIPVVTIKRTPSKANQYLPFQSPRNTATYEEIPVDKLDLIPGSPTFVNLPSQFLQAPAVPNDVNEPPTPRGYRGQTMGQRGPSRGFHDGQLAMPGGGSRICTNSGANWNNSANSGHKSQPIVGGLNMQHSEELMVENDLYHRNQELSC